MDNIKSKLTDKFKNNKYADKILFQISLFEQFGDDVIDNINENIVLIKDEIYNEKVKIIQNNIRKKQKRIFYFIIWIFGLLIPFFLYHYKNISGTFFVFYLYLYIFPSILIITLNLNEEIDSKDELIELCDNTKYVITIISKNNNKS